MKSILALIIAFVAFTSYGQSITVELDTSQALQNSDAGRVAYADIDLDGDNDLVINGNGSTDGITTTIYENDGNGNFTAMLQPDIVDVFGGSAKFADVDNDADFDLMLTGSTSSPAATANLYMNDGVGNFTLAAGTPFEASNAGDIDFGDIDGDNDLDLIMTGKDASGVVFSKLYVNDGTGSYSIVNGTSFTPAWESSTEFIDVDNDGDLDLLICGANASDVPNTNLYENNGSGIFSLVTGTPFDNTKGDIAFGDTDNDGDQDVLIVGTNDSSQTIAKLYLNSGGTFSLLSNTPFPGTNFHSSSFADFNNNGKLDLLHVGLKSTGVLISHIYENQGSNNFILSDSTLSGSYNGSNITADLNGDGKLDVVTTGTSFTAPIRAPKIYFNQSVNLSIPNSEDLNLAIFPNPSEGKIHLEIPSTSQKDLEIYDLTGKLVLKEDFIKSKQTIYLNEGHGVYLLYLTIDEKVYVRKVRLE